MQRREVVRLLLGTAAIPLLPREVLALFQQAHAQLPSAPALRTLTPHQDAIVSTIAELIIPETETPGAKSVRVNEFIDLILSEWFDAEDKANFLTGIDGVDRQSHELYSKDFVDCTAVQQKQLLTAMDEELTEMRQADRHAMRLRGRRQMPADRSFFYAVKQLTLVGYFTSEEGAKQTLHYQVIPADHSACVPLAEAEEATK